MSNSSPLNQQPSPKSNSRQLDEWVAVIVALLGIGSIFFWVMLRDNSGFTLKSPEIFVSSTQPSESSEPSDILKVKPDVEEDEKSSIQLDDSQKVEKSSSLPENNKSRETDNSLFRLPLSALPIVVLNSAAPVTEIPTPTPLTPTPSPSTPLTVTAETAEIPETVSEQTESKPTETTATTTATTTAVEFSDVAEDYWAKPAIESLVSRNIINPFPDGSFRPDAPVTRAELAVQLQKVFEQKSKQTGVNYKDIPKDSASASAINQVSQSGFLSGYPGGVFRPDRQVPRVQVLVAIASGLNLDLPDKPEKLLEQYKDAADIPNYAIAKVAAATQKGLVVNYPDRQLLNPNQPATRAEVSAIIYQALAISREVEPLSSPYVVQP